MSESAEGTAALLAWAWVAVNGVAPAKRVDSTTRKVDWYSGPMDRLACDGPLPGGFQYHANVRHRAQGPIKLINACPALGFTALVDVTTLSSPESLRMNSGRARSP
jgi:hypothetical protein